MTADPRTKKHDERLELNLSSHLKEQLMETGNASEYIRRAVNHRRSRYRSARMRLNRESFETNELMALCDTLRSYAFQDIAMMSPHISHEMEDAAEITEVHAKWDIDRERWDELASIVRDNETVARAVKVVAEEFRGPNDHVDFAEEWR
jgi:hypothetical protein